MHSKRQTTESQPNIPSNGVILVDKPSGIRSTALLNRVKDSLNIDKAGHAGTLDPFAEGLMVLLYGKATKLMEYIGEYKEYICTVRLGVKTDTDDPDGTVIKESPVPEYSKKEVEEILSQFKGKFRQKVPLYSAVKINGKRLYERARNGEEVEKLPSREVHIRELKILDYSLPFFQISCTARRGTYMRSLARDIGDELGCGAHLSRLRRIKVTPYDVSHAFKLEEIENNDFEVIKLKDALPHLPTITLSEKATWNFAHGGKVRGFYPEGIYQVKDNRGNFIGIGKGETYAVQPVKVFYSP